ncbi:hypothetical protein CCR94_15060 [Rhodoblastus sphagnicola]|uniref:Uncharacterized protein n=1 Tax=Rhodoblastus sphagnicola TaxID=333368 RepID=A0A2S6N4L7_9HYPH|nr:hypothetical protein [Rhodoblastus sphagnicola]MBB4196372.1 hypothetical protein [Rhodoblastus sphagnicola]PPQ29537.1 hypothetical protein CCR94_15060 [Rhodoblastus sphagnicola]
MRAAVVLGLIFSALGWWLLHQPVRPAPALIAGLASEGYAGAPCPARSLYEQDARKKRGPRADSAFAMRLREEFPLGSPSAALRDALSRQGFELFSPCANDENALGARWRGKNWGEPDAYVYWRIDPDEKLIFLDGHVTRAE